MRPSFQRLRLSKRFGARTMVSSAFGMVGGKTSVMFLGFVFWLLAARLATPEAVGLAAGATSTIMLVVLMGSSGIAAAVVVSISRRPKDAHEAVETALTAAAGLGLVVAAVALVLALKLLPELGELAQDPWFAGLFCLMGVLGSLGAVMDQASMAGRNGHHVFVRNVVNGIVTILPLSAIAVGLIADSATALFAAWVLGSASAIVVGLRQLRRTYPDRPSRPGFHPWALRSLLGNGPLNQVLTSAERAPGLVLPIVVTEVLSPANNAFWYTAWMMAWGVAVVPLSMGMALFAEVCQDPNSRRDHTRKGIRSSLLVGIPMALVVIAIAPLVLSILGEEYSDAGTGPLRLLVLAVVPLAFTYSYFAVARAIGRLGEAIATALVGGVAGVVVASLAGNGSGLTAMAAAWVSVQALVGLWSVYRLHRLTSPDFVIATIADSPPEPHAVVTPEVKP